MGDKTAISHAVQSSSGETNAGISQLLMSVKSQDNNGAPSSGQHQHEESLRSQPVNKTTSALPSDLSSVFTTMPVDNMLRNINDVDFEKLLHQTQSEGDLDILLNPDSLNFDLQDGNSSGSGDVCTDTRGGPNITSMYSKPSGPVNVNMLNHMYTQGLPQPRRLTESVQRLVRPLPNPERSSLPGLVKIAHISNGSGSSGVTQTGAVVSMPSQNLSLPMIGAGGRSVVVDASKVAQLSPNGVTCHLVNNSAVPGPTPLKITVPPVAAIGLSGDANGRPSGSPAGSPFSPSVALAAFQQSRMNLTPGIAPSSVADPFKFSATSFDTPDVLGQTQDQQFRGHQEHMASPPYGPVDTMPHAFAVHQQLAMQAAVIAGGAVPDTSTRGKRARKTKNGGESNQGNGKEPPRTIGDRELLSTYDFMLKTA